MTQLYMSTSGYGGIRLDQALEDISKAGITHVELSVGCLGNSRTPELLTEYYNKGFKFIPHHNSPIDGKSHPIDLCKKVPTNYFTKVFEFCKAVGAGHYSVHGGSYDPSEINYTQAMNNYITNLYQAKNLASQYGIELAVETMYPTKRGAKFVLDTAESILDFRVHHPDIGLVVDCAHVNIMMHQGVATSSFLRTLLDDEKVVEIHLSENDGIHDHHTPITRNAWFWGALRSRPDVPIICEGRLNHMGYETLKDNYQMVMSLL